MGTRCLTFVYDGETPILNLYRQYDGYPTGHGAELAEFLSKGKKDKLLYNGMGCLAAQLVAYFKDTPGHFYIHAINESECGQDYEYHIYPNPAPYKNRNYFNIKVVNRGCNMFGLTSDDTNETIFQGSLVEFQEFCKEKEKAAA
jgi:hypothetical protein